MFGNPAASSISIDLLLFLSSASIWMVLEARKLRVRHVWAYIVFGFVIAISVTFPLFLVARERALARLSV